MRESLILLAIGLADLLCTLLFVGAHGATEGNPIMSYYLQCGIGAFVVVKLVLLFFPVFIAEWSKRYKPRFVRLMLRGAIVAYLGSYLLMFVVVNVAPLVVERFTTPPQSHVRVADRAR